MLFKSLDNFAFNYLDILDYKRSDFQVHIEYQTLDGYASKHLLLLEVNLDAIP